MQEKNSEQNTYLPKLDFTTFIASLNASAMVSFGAIQDPATGKKNKNLIIGKQTIDILVMLQEKTRGNLTKQESDMLQNILYDLKIIFVKERG